MTISFNYQNSDIVSSPTVIVSGSTSTRLPRGVISFINDDNKVFPPQYFEVNNGQFKAILHVAPNERNFFKAEVSDNGSINAYGFAEYGGGQAHVIDSGELTLQFIPLPQNKPIHLCLIRGRDSPNTYDVPRYRLNRGEAPTLENAIKKLKVAGRLMQAYTQDEMRSAGFSNRSFQFVEETVHDQGIFGYSQVQSPTPHQEVKIHVLTSTKTVAELRSPDLAQQNPNAKDSGGLFSHAIDLVRNTPEIFNQRNGTAVQCACIYLDSTWDHKLILTHAALGGGTNDVKMAIFGSHGLHSFPQNFPLVTPSFLDATHLTTNEVANDCNQCGTSWECLNICLGAFMHEIGHSLGCPHQVDGVMLRDYMWFNRSFMTRENECLRTRSRGEVIAANGTWSKVCHWNRLDLIRFLFHDSFSVPIDQFGKVYATTREQDNSYNGNSAPSSYSLPMNGSLIKSSAGVYMVEVITDDLARYHKEFLPREYGGPGLQTAVAIEFNDLYNGLKSKKGDAKDNFRVRVLSLGGELNIDNFKDHCSHQNQDVIKSDFGLGRGTLTGFKSATLGRADNLKMQYVGFDLKSVYKVRVFSGSALDGIIFYYTSGGRDHNNSAPPKIPKRDYLSKLVRGVQDMYVSDRQEPEKVPDRPSSGETREAVIGKTSGKYSEFTLNQGEYITSFNFRDGAWMDAIQFQTNQGRVSPMYGNANGGHASILEPPTSDFDIVGMYFYLNNWLRGIGIIYTSKN